MTRLKLTDLGQEIFQTRYAYPGETKWQERAKVIAKTVASAEADEDKEKYEKVFYDSIADGDFVPGGRIIYGAGRNAGKHNLLNCYVISPEDSVASIGKTLDDMYTISCAGGGIGFNVSKIRPKGDDISNVKNSAPGAVSFLKMINEVGEHVKSGKARRTALIGILNVTHPDLLEFLQVKLEKGELTNFNISVAITDRFIEAVQLDEDWYFTFNNKEYHNYVLQATTNKGVQRFLSIIALDEEDAIGRAKGFHLEDWTETFEVVKKDNIKAKWIWEKIWMNSVNSGDPGVYNIDLSNKHTNTSYFESLDSTNPCGEIPLPSYGNCCLGNINLSNMVTDDGEVDWPKLAKTVRAGVRFLDNVLTVNHFPIPKCKEVGHNSRRIGLGVFGLHYMLIKLSLRYGSEKCLEFLERLFSTIRDEAYKTSIYLARDKHPFPAFDKDKYLAEGFCKTLPIRIRHYLRKYGIRNAVILTVPPTGTISMLMGVSSGIEPIFSAMYQRRYRQGNVWKETLVVDPLFKEYHAAGKGLGAFVGAYDITPEDHMRVQATIQHYIDSSLSKTINLPEDFEPSTMIDQALEFMPSMKGMTVYRAGSKGNEPLKAIPLTKENVDKYMKEPNETANADGQACSIAGGGCGD